MKEILGRARQLVKLSCRTLRTAIVLPGGAFGNGNRLSKVSFKNDANEDSENRVKDAPDELLEPSSIAVTVPPFVTIASTLLSDFVTTHPDTAL
ncbi:hypothetical protein QE152_g19735 [Popillia japonica]|uniref:Uncharacterized protein n=1 Tax=Popillia japonica TaxID=7064 RepID=A0AAW1KQM4_POPJA